MQGDRATIRTEIENSLGGDLDCLLMFGSRARGDARPDSDWDIVVVVKDEADYPAARQRIRRLAAPLFERIGAPVTMVPMRWRDAGDYRSLLLNLERDAVRL